MNPALLQNTFHLEYPLNTDKFAGQDRTYPTSTHFTSNDFPFVRSKVQPGLNNASLGETLSVPANTSQDHNLHSPIPDTFCNYPPGSQVLLSPPSSVDGTHTGSLQLTSPSFDFQNGSRFVASNASSTDNFTTTITHYPDSPWSMGAMTDLRQQKPSTFTPPLNNLSFNPPGINFPYSSSSNRTMEPSFPASFSFSGRVPYNGLEFSDASRQQPRSPPLGSTLQPVPPFMTHRNYPFGPMPTQQLARQEGPPFDETKIVYPLVTSRNQPLGPDISASIQKGFFQVEGKWTCYRRNYFAVSCAFTFKSGVPDGPVFLQRQSQLEPVQQYAVSISARTANVNNQESENRQLVQHTPKRDKATETVPGRHVVQPATPQSLQVGSTMSLADRGYHSNHHVSQCLLGTFDSYNSPSHLTVPTSYTFDRIQFQKATANNGKRRAQQQYFHVVVELSVNVGRPGGDDNWVIIATRQSHPMVVRGRSPGHYKDNGRREPNMDPDRGNSHGGDGRPMGLPGPHFLSSGQSSSMNWTSSHQPGHYSSSYSRYAYDSAYSPHSAGSSTTLTESPTESDFKLQVLSTSKSGTACDFGRAIATSNPDRDGYTGIGHSYQADSRKRSFDDHVSDYEQDFYTSTNCAEERRFSPRSFNYNDTSNAKPLCAL